jgi:hypothetical protein
MLHIFRPLGKVCIHFVSCTSSLPQQHTTSHLATLDPWTAPDPGPSETWIPGLLEPRPLESWTFLEKGTYVMLPPNICSGPKIMCWTCWGKFRGLVYTIRSDFKMKINICCVYVIYLEYLFQILANIGYILDILASCSYQRGLHRRLSRTVC